MASEETVLHKAVRFLDRRPKQEPVQMGLLDTEENLLDREVMTIIEGSDQEETLDEIFDDLEDLDEEAV